MPLKQSMGQNMDTILIDIVKYGLLGGEIIGLEDGLGKVKNSYLTRATASFFPK